MGEGGSGTLAQPGLGSPSRMVGSVPYIYSIYIRSIGPWMNKPTAASGVCIWCVKGLALFKFSNTGRSLQLQQQPARNHHSTRARRLCTGHIAGLQCWTFTFEYCCLHSTAMTDKENLCDLHDDNDDFEGPGASGASQQSVEEKAVSTGQSGRNVEYDFRDGRGFTGGAR
jgi:hypothetical protein